MKIGVVLESFQKSFLGALKEASGLGLDGAQIYGTMGELNVDTITPAKIREARGFIEGEGLILSAICGDMGCKMFYEPKTSVALIEREKAILYMAKELGCNIVTTHIGVVPTDKNSERYQNMLETCGILARYADSLSGHFAIETGPEMSITLKGFLDNLNSIGVGVNLDPANLVMCAGDDPVVAVENLKRYIVHTHAKDGIMIQKTDTRRIYDAEHDGLTAVVYDDYFRELPLGEGAVEFSPYLLALKKIGYDGFLTIEREVGANPAADIHNAATFLRNKLSVLGIG